MSASHLPIRQRSSRVYIMIGMLVLAALACSLGKKGEPTKVPTPTPLVTSTFVVPTVDPNSTSSETPPTVAWGEPAEGTLILVNTEVLLQAVASHETGATRAIFRAQKEGSENPTVLNSLGINSPEPERTLTYRWTPREVGNYTLSVIAYRGDAASEPASVQIEVVSSEQVTPQPTQDLGPCTITAVVAVSVRSGPGRTFADRGNMREGEVASVTGQNNDSSGQGWFQIRRDNGQTGWVIASPEFVESQGGCLTVPVVRP